MVTSLTSPLNIYLINRLITKYFLNKYTHCIISILYIASPLGTLLINTFTIEYFLNKYVDYIVLTQQINLLLNTLLINRLTIKYLLNEQTEFSYYRNELPNTSIIDNLILESVQTPSECILFSINQQSIQRCIYWESKRE